MARFVATFACATTDDVDDIEELDDIKEDSNVVGECLRTLLQFKFNRAVLVKSIELEKEKKCQETIDIIFTRGETHSGWEKKNQDDRITNGDKRQKKRGEKPSRNNCDTHH